jgi:hypothetical protein
MVLAGVAYRGFAYRRDWALGRNRFGPMEVLERLLDEI